MIKRIRQNRSLRASNRKKFKGDNRKTIYAGTNEKNKASFKEFPESQVKAVIKKIREKAESKRRKELAFATIIGVIVTIIIIYALLPSKGYSESPEVKNQDLERKAPKPIAWSGKLSEPLKIPFSNFLYIPIVGNLDHVDLNRTYKISPSNMVVEYTSNILFFDKDSVAIGKLLTKNGFISFMMVGPNKKELEPKKIVYMLAEQDSNKNGKVNHNDKRFLYISDLNGKNLTKITERKMSSIQWVSQGKVILMRFHDTKETNDSIYGLFNTETKELKYTNQLGEGF